MKVTYAARVRAIRNDADYEWALNEIAPYFENEPVPGTSAAERFDVLADLIEAYEARHWPIEPADPLDVLKEVMALKGYSQADLAQLLDSRSRASEILLGKRRLTLDQMYRLHTQWGIPAKSLLRTAN